MKVNLFKTSEPNCLILRAEAPFNITDVLFNFLSQVSHVSPDTVEVVEENVIKFATTGVGEEEYKDWKLSIINAVRDLLTQTEEQLRESFLVTRQQLEAIEREFTSAQAKLLQAQLELVVANNYNQKLLMIMGLAVIVALVALLVAVVGVLI